MITHDFKLFFVHIPKCAGRSVCDIFNQRFDHYTADYLSREYKPHWESYEKFSIIRNPFDRMVSLYIYIQNHRRHKYERIAVADPMPTFKQWLTININNYQGSFLGDPLTAEGNRGTDGDLGSSFWFTSQAERLCDKQHNLLVPRSNIFRLEDGTEKVEKFLQKITGVWSQMPHSNKSEYNDYRSFYDDELVEKCKNFSPISLDMGTFNYKF